MPIVEAIRAPLLELGLVKITQTPPISASIVGMRAAPAGHDGGWFERSIKWGLGIRINEVWRVVTKPPS